MEKFFGKIQKSDLQQPPKFKQFLKAVSRKFTLLRGVNFKISPDFGPHICKQTGQKSKSNCKHINILRNFNLRYNKITRNHVIYKKIIGLFIDYQSNFISLIFITKSISSKS